MTKDNTTAKDYHKLLKPSLADALYEKILQKLVVEKIYRIPNYSAVQLARELETNTRYVSTVMKTHFGTNFADLMNQHRIREAKRMLRDKRYAIYTMEEIAKHVGFCLRQSLYSAFQRHVGMTPKQYQEQLMVNS